MEKQTQSLKLKLVVQGSTTIAQGQTPVLVFQSQDGTDPRERIAETVNFLRSGCPSVSWLVDGFSRPGCGWKIYCEWIDRILIDLQVHGELLLSTWSADYERKDDFVVMFERGVKKE